MRKDAVAIAGWCWFRKERQPRLSELRSTQDDTNDSQMPGDPSNRVGVFALFAAVEQPRVELLLGAAAKNAAESAKQLANGI